MRDDLQRALDLINAYYEYEFDDDPNSLTPDDDLSYIGLVYTTTGNGGHDIQVTVDLYNFDINYEVDGQLVYTEHYDSLADLIDAELSDIVGPETFGWYYNKCCEYGGVSDDD